VDSLKARGELVPAGAGARASAPAPAAEPRRVQTAVITADRRQVGRRFSILSRTIAGQMICVGTCVVTIVLWVNVRHAFTYMVTVVAAGLLAVGVARRVPFTGWALIGLAVGLLLGRFS